ncbi:MAG: DUF11 domain-containing protein [Saprospiraceae bacterium]|nr:DUF11 domain-containing protein [Saprospiraceae bacterium]
MSTCATSTQQFRLLPKSASKLLSLVFLFLSFAEINGQKLKIHPDSVHSLRVKETLKKNAEIIRFMENKGQVPIPEVKYYLEGKQGTVLVMNNKLRFVANDYITMKKESPMLKDKDNKPVTEDEKILTSQHSFSMEFVESNPNPKLVLGNSFSTRYNFFLGTDESKWVSGVSAAKDITLEDVYPGIDIRLYSNEDGSLEFDWVMEPGADYSKINLLFDGQDKLSIGKKGELNVGLRFRDIKFNIPESYQVAETGKVPVNFAFKTDDNHVSFKTNSKIDPQLPLVIDPTLSWGTFMDGNDPDFDQYLFGIQVDPTDGIVYCAGASNRQIATASPPYDANGYKNVITGFGTGATPRVAMVYRVSSSGNDLIDLTLYGPDAVSGSNEVAAYALSLSTNNVFIGGRTTVNLPMTGSPFDGTRNGNDGFIAVFSKDLGTLHYSTYIGSTGTENLGVPSIRALSDNSYIFCATVTAALDAAYITSGVADNSFSGDADGYIAKFSSFNSIDWGTYVGGGEEETLNDIEVFADGRVAFAGWGNNTDASLTETNPASSGSNSNGNLDGFIGVLNSTGTAFNYREEIGGANADQFNDVEIVNGLIAFTGSVSSGYPTTGGTYDTSHNGETDAVVGVVNSAGSSGYAATFFGGPGSEIGSGVQQVSQTNCDGSVQSFLLVFGTAEAGIPTVNIGSDPFYNSSNSGGLDMFFAGFNQSVTTLQYATNIGGQYNDYLGDTGAPRGANHLYVKGANIFVGTTTHSASHTPTVVSGGFDTQKSNTGNPTQDDTHVLFSILFNSLLESDYSDAPSSYGAPSHTLDCANIRINSLDSEGAATPGANANGDDNAGIDDEDGISTFPIYQAGGPQNISVNVNSIINTTGLAATLYGWIDFNNDGVFNASELASTSVANGFSGTKTLNWTGVTVSGAPSGQYLRLRLTTNSLSDDGSTSTLDERSTASASNGEVEDYLICVKPTAGTDKTVSCISLPGGSSTMTATGTGTWTAQAGNPGTATITNTSSPTTTITNFSVAGDYFFIWTNSTACAKDTVKITVTAKPNAGINQNVNCAVLPGGTATMAAVGSGTWTAQVGNPGTASITNSTSPTTTITNFSVAGTYNFIWTNASNCTDTASVIVTAKPNAGSDQNITCLTSLPGGSATMAGTGSGTWTAQAGNPGTASITNTTSPTTTITNFSVAGTYYFIWTNASNCTDTASVTVTAKPNAGADQNVSCVVSFPGGSATMTGTGTGTWTAQAGNPGTASITNTSSPTTTITNFSALGTYSFIWTNGSNCTDTARVIVTSKPDAGADQNVNCVASFPGGTATMAASGSGTWTAQAGNPGTSNITNTSSPTTTITNFSVAGTYSYIWTNGSNCADTARVIVTAKPNAGADQNVNCVASFPGGSATMAATGSGTWSAQAGNPGTASITNTSSPTTTITSFSVAGTYNFIWTNGSNCTDTASIVVTAKPNAGADQNVNCVASFPGGSASMAGTGTGTWSAQAGNPGTASITNTTSPTTTITNFSVAGTYNFIWTNASNCTDTASITVTAKPNAGVDQNVSCVVSFPGGSATMAGTGTGTWTAQAGNPGTASITNTNSPTTTITNFSALGTYSFIWTNGSNCTDTARVIVTSKPDAGPDQNVNCVTSFPGGTATMAASGSGTWTAQAGNPGSANITNTGSPTTTITNFSVVGTYSFIWTNGSNCADTARVIVTAKPNAGADQNVNCVAAFPGGSATMAATGTGTWSAQAGNPGSASITNTTSPTTSISNFSVAGTYHFIWTNASNCTDTASVTVTAKPNAGADQNVNCVAAFPGGSATMAGTGTGIWSAQAGNPGTASITNTSSPTTTITNFSVAGTYNFIWTNASNCTDTASVTVTAKPNAGVDQNVSCVISFPGGSATMAGTGTGTWTAQAGNPGSASITNSGSPTTTITNFSVIGTYSFIWTNGSNCTDTARVIVTSKPDAGPDQNVNCVASFPGGSATMAGTGTGTWAAQAGNPGTASITNYSSSNTTITNFSNAGTYNFIWTNGSNCSDTASVIVTAKPNAGSDKTVSCVNSFPGGSTNMTGSGSGTWTAQTGNPGTATIVDPSSATTEIRDFSALGVYNFIYTNASNCKDTARVTVTQGPIGSATPQTICSGLSTSIPLNSTVFGTTFTWTASHFSGALITGFSNCAAACGSSIAQTLSNSSNFASGIVRYTVIPTAPNGCVGNSFTVDVTVNPTPVVTVSTTPACIGQNNGTAQANVSGGVMAYSYIWSNGQVIPNLSNLSPGTFNLTVTDANQCTKTSSGTVIEQGISSMTATPGACNSLNNLYSVSGTMSFLNPPTSGTLTVSVGAVQQVFNAPFTSPQAYILNGLVADGAVHTVTAIFSGGANCSKTVNYTAPVNCLPVIRHTKNFVSATQTGAYTYSVVYSIVVTNSGGAGQYDLSDVPSFDDDIVINNASYTSNAPGNPGSALGVAPWVLANDQAIVSGGTHTYTLTVSATINLNPASGGNNVYTKCGQAIPGNPSPGEALYNSSRLDTNNDGIPEETQEACGDIPYITHDKTIASITNLGANMYQVNYQIIVRNLGGVASQYDLNDIPSFDDDISINTSSYTSNAPGNPGAALAGNGPWILANNQSIGIGSIHTYQLAVKVTLDLKVGSSGNNIYTKCGQSIPGTPIAGEGLFNKSNIDTNDDGVFEESDEVCGDLPYLISTKTISSITPLGGNQHNVVYQVVVTNIGGANGQYDLLDTPGFENDIAINSASYTSNAPANPGSALAGSGPWTLANDQSILPGATHSYTLTVRVTLDLSPGSGGDNVYTKCEQGTPGDPTASQGLYNQSTVDINNDGIPEITSEVCGDLPYITHDKTLGSIQNLGSNMYNITYNIVVRNTGGVSGPYDLFDAPGFDDDISILSASYTSNVGGNPGAALLGSGPWQLANDQNILAGATQTYVIVVKVSLDLKPGSSGDNVYRKCEQTTPGNPIAGEGLFNLSRIDTNNDGIPEQTDVACGDLPYLSHDKTISSIVHLGSNMYNVSYQIVVTNTGGATGQYNLSDIPGFDDDFTIVSSSYTSTAPGNPGSALAGNGPWTLANNQSILVSATYTYTVLVKTTLDLNPGSSGDNFYRSCGTQVLGDPSAGEGLYNQSRLDVNNDGIADETDEVCSDVPFITNSKTLTGITNLGGNMYNVTYQMTVRNTGGAVGQYDLIDVPGFDNDISIVSASFTSTAPGNAGGVLAGIGPWTLANDQNILAGANHVYTITVKVTLDLSPLSGGNNVYTKCGQATPGDPVAGEGLYNQALLDTNNDGIPDDTDEVCGDLPYITHDKTVLSITPVGANTYNVSYQIEVRNIGGATGQYDLTDAPGFDNDFTIITSSYTSNVVGNPGNNLLGSGPWLLANDQTIPAGSTHTYTVLIRTNLDLAPGSGGDNLYRACGTAVFGDPAPGEALYNQSRLDFNNDGIADETDEVCSDLPFITNEKTISGITNLGGNMYNVTYVMTVRNLGGLPGQYDLVDIPGFDDDITINNASYTSTAPGVPGGALLGTGPWSLANDQAILAGATHSYTITVKITLDLSPNSPGNNVYTKCGQITPGNPAPGEGLYNQALLDTNNDGVPEETDEVCGDVPYIIHDKTIASIVPLGANMYNVSYQIVVRNIGGTTGQYDLIDAQGFDNDFTINNASFTSTAPGNPGSALAGSGPWMLANDLGISAGAIHTYLLTIKVSLDLEPGSGGDNVYTKCGNVTPGNPAPGEGLYNESRIDVNNDGIPEETDEVCGDVPYVTSSKTVSSITPLGANKYAVSYQLVVRNLGAVNGNYNLVDAPGFDDDISINSASYTSTAPGNPGGALIGAGPWSLANILTILPGATHTYTLTINVTLDLSPLSSGDNVYTKCGNVTPGNPAPGEGLYNELRMDSNNDGIPEETDEVCADIPYVTHEKTIQNITPLGGNMYNISYQILVRNIGGANGNYDLTDLPGLDDDITINTSSYTSSAPGNPGAALNTTGPWTLANDQGILAGATHTYTVVLKVTLDLNPASGGNNIYTKCGATTPGDPNTGEGLYNQSRLDSNNDGVPEETKETCGDLPFITSSKTVGGISSLGGNMYNVSYDITVRNLGGASGTYDLTDAPGFDDDITINNVSYTSTVVGNPGGVLAGTGPWTLANDQNIPAGAIQTYTLSFKVTIDLKAGSGGNNVYNSCGQSNPGNPIPGEGLFNEARVDLNNDGVPDITNRACGDLPYVAHEKTISSITPLGSNMYHVSYNIVVRNDGGSQGVYDLTDLPGFDDDIAIQAASFTTNIPGKPGSALALAGPWILANNQTIDPKSTQTYTVLVKVTLDLSTGSGGNNVYTKCGAVIPNDPTSGEGLYNQSRIDHNDDGIPEDTKETCGDLPYITHEKTLVSTVSNGGNKYQINYQVVVRNLGGANGQYDLTDIPGFDDDISINSASFSSNAPANPGGALAGSGPWVLANNQAILAGGMHTYQLTVHVTIDLNPLSSGNNSYTKCGSAITADPAPGEGLYNQSRLDANEDGIPDETKEACGDLPYVFSSKTLTSTTNLGDHRYQVTYLLNVQNSGGANGTYDLLDTPAFDDDISIISANYVSNAPGTPGGVLPLAGPWTLANDQSIAPGASHNFTLTLVVGIDLSAGSSGNNVYTKCGQAVALNPSPGEGLYNRSNLDINNDGVYEDEDVACGDLPYVVSTKTISGITNLGGHMYEVSYQLNVTNQGGSNGIYDLLDAPGFDDDITISSASFSSNAPGNSGTSLAGLGPWQLANDQLITPGSTHNYILKVIVTIDLSPASGGNNIYTKCGQSIPNDPNVGEGLYNRSTLDINNDGRPEDTDETCGDLPYITSTKTVSSITPLGNGMHTIQYQLTVRNLGAATGTYDLTDKPGFDDDLSINQASYTSSAPSNPGGNLAGTGPWMLANDQSILPGAIHTYNLTIKATVDLKPGSGGDNVYRNCGFTIPNQPSAGEGVFNESLLDINNDGIPEESNKVCDDIDIVDVALRVTIVEPAPYAYDQLLTFKIDVFNQGNIDLTNIVLNDYLPSGFTFNPADNLPGWSQINPGLLNYNSIASIPAGGSTSVNLRLRVVRSAAYNAWNNQVEVRSFRDIGGVDRSLEDLDSNPNSNNAVERSVKQGDPADNNITSFDKGGEEDDHDPAGFEVFDLALRKILKGTLPLVYNQVVPFEITVFNQGSIASSNPLIVDYIPDGLVFEASSNPGWTYNAITKEATRTLIGKIIPADSAKMTINLRVVPNLVSKDAWNNIAEIRTGFDSLGNVLSDFDSTPGGTKDDDGTPIDNEINNPADEDDHDPSEAPVLDFALRKTVFNKKTFYTIGESVPFRIKLFNQGNISGRNIVISDYLSAGYQFNAIDNPGWSLAGSTLTYTHAPLLRPKDSVEIALSLVVKIAAVPSITDWDNYVELRSVRDSLNNVRDLDDADSRPNTNSAWERQVVENHPWDNLIDGNGQAENEDEDDHDFENIKVTATIGDRVWDDLDGDGIQDPGEPGLPNIIVKLIDCANGTVVRRDTTDINGKYLFDFLIPFNNYAIQLDHNTIPSGYGVGLQNQGPDRELDNDFNAAGMGPCVRVEPGTIMLSYDAGLVRLASYGVFIWEDDNGDGIQDPGEDGVGGVLVSLFNANTHTVVKTTTSGANGFYLFDKLLPGSYYARYDLPAGYNFSLANIGSDLRDSDVENSNGPRTNATTYLSPGEDDLTWAAGLVRCVMLSGRVYFDVDKDGIFDVNENGINGLKVFLIDAMTGAVISTLITAVDPSTPSNDGYYKFNCVKPGMYYIRFDRPGHLAASNPYQGGNPDKDSDISHENGLNSTKKFTVGSGDMLLNIGAGFQDKATIGDRVWLDANVNGVQDVLEKPISGVVVTAYNLAGTMVSMDITGFDGTYMLDGVPQGDFYVKFSPPVQYGFTHPKVGSDQTDSDVTGSKGYGTTKVYRLLAGDALPYIDAGLVAGILPLEWLSFEGHYNGSFTELDWSTGFEINNSHFVIERRHESEAGYTELGQVSASQDAQASIHDYHFDDHQVVKFGVYYYRIKQLDLNGDYTYSNTISIKVDRAKGFEVEIYPNPVDDQLKVELWINEDSYLNATVYDENGKNVLTQPFGGWRVSGKYTEILPTDLLLPGHYNLQIRTATGLINKKFTVSR